MRASFESRSLVADVCSLLWKPLIAIVLLLPLLRALKAGLVEQIGANPTLCFMLAGTFAIHMWSRPNRRECASTLALALAMKLSYATLGGGFGTYFGASVVGTGSFLGLASLAVLVFRVLRSRDGERKATLSTLVAGAVLPYTWVFLREFLLAGIHLRPMTYDLYLYFADGSLGVQPSFWLGRILARHATLNDLTWLVYCALPFVVSVVYASQRLMPGRRVQMLPLYISMMLVGFALYSVFPAAGPIYVFREAFPTAAPEVLASAVRPIALEAVPRNAMPSLHVAGALLAVWNARHWSRLARAILLLFTFWTVFAIFALGEHYVVDLVVAFPFAMAFQVAWTRSLPLRPTRLRLVVAGWAITVAWLVLLRYGMVFFETARPAPTVLMFATVAWCSIAEARFAIRASKAGALAPPCQSC